MMKRAAEHARILIVIGLLTAACQPAVQPTNAPTAAPTAVPTPVVGVVNHPAPTMPAIDVEPFRQASTVPDDDTTFYRAGPQVDPNQPLARLGCLSISKPPADLGALSPAYPLALCRARADAGEGLYRSGCLLPTVARYVIHRNGQFELIETSAELAAVYAPIESEAEALSYALAATGYEARYGLSADAGYRRLTSPLEDTHVTAVDGGYEVTVYQYRLCGCGPHTYTAVRLKVTVGGEVQVLDRTPAFEDPADDGLCID